MRLNDLLFDKYIDSAMCVLTLNFERKQNSLVFSPSPCSGRRSHFLS